MKTRNETIRTIYVHTYSATEGVIQQYEGIFTGDSLYAHVRRQSGFNLTFSPSEYCFDLASAQEKARQKICKGIISADKKKAKLQKILHSELPAKQMQ